MQVINLVNKYREHNFRINTVVDFIDILSSSELQSSNSQSPAERILASAEILIKCQNNEIHVYYIV